MVEIKELFKNRLDKALEYNNMKPADLAKKTGISEATISQYRSGYSKPKDKRLIIIANALHVDPTWLMGLDVPMKKETVVDGSTLSPDEADLLSNYQKLNANGKDKAQEYVSDLADQKKYTEDTGLSSARAG